MDRYELSFHRPIGRHLSVAPEDSRALKDALNRLGYYAGRFDIGAYVDDEMFDGLERFQSDNGLAGGGEMKPGDISHWRLARAVAERMLASRPNEAGGPAVAMQELIDPQTNVVTVRAYRQGRDGEVIEVRAHERGAPSTGADRPAPALPRMVSPVPNPRIRGQDAYGAGHYGASRDGGQRRHNGIDIVAQPGQPIVSPVDGTIIRTDIDPYSGVPGKAKKFLGMAIKTENQETVRILYVTPHVTEGQKVVAGQTVLGTVQTLSRVYPPKNHGRMTNHIHIDVRVGGKLVDPTNIIMKK